MNWWLVQGVNLWWLEETSKDTFSPSDHWPHPQATPTGKCFGFFFPLVLPADLFSGFMGEWAATIAGPPAWLVSSCLLLHCALPISGPLKAPFLSLESCLSELDDSEPTCQNVFHDRFKMAFSWRGLEANLARRRATRLKQFWPVNARQSSWSQKLCRESISFAVFHLHQLPNPAVWLEPNGCHLYNYSRLCFSLSWQAAGVFLCQN